MIIKSVSIKKYDFDKDIVLAWFLDKPVNLIKFEKNLVSIQGWILFKKIKNKSGLIFVSDLNGQVLFELPLNQKRPDVVKRVLNENPSSHEQIQCGFEFRVNSNFLMEGMRLGVNFDNQEILLADLQLSDVLKVLEGKEGWLFLDNDTNNSVDQYTGKRMLSSDELHSWRNYLSSVHNLAKDSEVQHALVIAPSKEEVLPHRYPFQRASITVLDQVCALAKPEWNVLNAAPLLSSHSPPESCFIQMDTHWTDRGAMLAVLAFVKKVGLDAVKAASLFEGDDYEFRRTVGDLGSKLLPARSAETEFLKSSSSGDDVLFDNEFINFGRTIIYENKSAIFPVKILVFGGSSSYSMLKYLKRLFGRLVFVHSAAHIDIKVLEHERPDVLLLQTNARFLVQPPNLNFSLSSTVYKKSQEVSTVVRDKLKKYISENEFNGMEYFYKNMTLHALNQFQK